MARKVIITENDVRDETVDIVKVVSKYFDDKTFEKDLKASMSAGNEIIKTYMNGIGKDKEVIGDYKISISVQDKSTMNEDKLLVFCKAHNLTDLIKTREYVDSDALESAIYNGKISKELLVEMDSCKEPKFVTSLRVTKAKRRIKLW